MPRTRKGRASTTLHEEKFTLDEKNRWPRGSEIEKVPTTGMHEKGQFSRRGVFNQISRNSAISEKNPEGRSRGESKEGRGMLFFRILP